MHYELTIVPDTQLVRLDYVFLGSQWLQNHPLQARFAFSQLKEGSVRYDDGSLTEWLENYGVTLSTQTNLSYSTVTVYCMHRHLQQVVSILNSMFTEPVFPEDKLSLALSQARTNWQIQHQKVATVCKEEFYRQLYGPQHPMGCFPALADYDMLTTQHLRDFHHRYIRPNYMTLLLTGCIDDKDLRMLENYVGTDDKVIHYNTLYQPKTPVSSDERTHRIHTGQDHVQAAVRVGCLLPPANHPDMPMIRLVTTLLGGYFGSRLMSNIRERRGLTYGINATIYNVPHDNALSIACETATQSAEEVVREVYGELQRLCEDGVPEDELQMVKQYMKGQACRRYERSFNFPQVQMNLLATGRTFDDLTQEQNIQQMATPDDVQRMAKRYFAPERFTDCVVV